MQEDRQVTVSDIASNLDIVDLYILSMTITYIITKFLQDGGQSSLQMSTDGYVLEHECISCGTTLVRKMLLCSGLSQTVEHECTAMKMQINVIYGAETHFITQDQELQNCAFCQQSDVHQQDHGQSVIIAQCCVVPQ